MNILGPQLASGPLARGFLNIGLHTGVTVVGFGRSQIENLLNNPTSTDPGGQLEGIRWFMVPKIPSDPHRSHGIPHSKFEVVDTPGHADLGRMANATKLQFQCRRPRHCGHLQG